MLARQRRGRDKKTKPVKQGNGGNPEGEDKAGVCAGAGEKSKMEGVTDRNCYIRPMWLNPTCLLKSILRGRTNTQYDRFLPLLLSAFWPCVWGNRKQLLPIHFFYSTSDLYVQCKSLQCLFPLLKSFGLFCHLPFIQFGLWCRDRNCAQLCQLCAGFVQQHSHVLCFVYSFFRNDFDSFSPLFFWLICVTRSSAHFIALLFACFFHKLMYVYFEQYKLKDRQMHMVN